MFRLGSLLLCGSAAHQCGQNLVLDALHTACLGQCLRIQRHAKALVHLDSQFDGHDGSQSDVAQHGCHAEVLGVDDLCDDVVDFLLQHVHRHIRVHFHVCGLLFWLWKGFFVHFLVLVQRNCINLHRHGRHHVRRFLVEDEVVQRFDVDGFVGNDVGGDEFATAFLVEGLHRGILDAGELTNHGFHFFQFDAESANLHLSVATTHKLDVTRRQIAHYVARTIDTGVFLTIFSKRIGDIHLSRFLGPVQVSSAHLRTANPQFSGSAYRQTATL